MISLRTLEMVLDLYGSQTECGLYLVQVLV